MTLFERLLKRLGYEVVEDDEFGDRMVAEVLLAAERGDLTVRQAERLLDLAERAARLNVEPDES